MINYVNKIKLSYDMLSRRINFKCLLQIEIYNRILSNVLKTSDIWKIFTYRKLDVIGRHNSANSVFPLFTYIFIDKIINGWIDESMDS